MNLGVISNPKSRKNRKNKKIIKKLKAIVGKDGKVFQTNTLDDIYKVAEIFKARKIEVLGINGGDGTIHVTLSIFIKVYEDQELPKIAILRGGTMNTIANSIKSQKGTPKEILRNIIEKYNSDTPFTETQRNILKVNNDYGFIFGNGIIYNFLEIYYKSKDPSPLIAAKTLVGSALKSFVNKRSSLFKKIRIEIETDDIKWVNNKFLAVAALGVREMGLGFAPGARIKDDPNKFYIFAFSNGPMALLRSLPKLWLGYSFSGGVAQEKITSKVVLRSEKPMPYTIDGEMHSPYKEITITKGPRITFIIK